MVRQGASHQPVICGYSNVTVLKSHKISNLVLISYALYMPSSHRVTQELKNRAVTSECSRQPCAVQEGRFGVVAQDTLCLSYCGRNKGSLRVAASLLLFPAGAAGYLARNEPGSRKGTKFRPNGRRGSQSVLTHGQPAVSGWGR